MNRNNLRIFGFVIICMLTACFFACDDSGSDGATAEFVGTWEYSVSKDAVPAPVPQSVTFTLTDYIIDFGTESGTFEVDITSYDEEADHILGTVTNADNWPYAVGDPVYMTYGITSDGTEIEFEIYDEDFPADPDGYGPFIKQ